MDIFAGGELDDVGSTSQVSPSPRLFTLREMVLEVGMSAVGESDPAFWTQRSAEAVSDMSSFSGLSDFLPCCTCLAVTECLALG